MNRASDEMLKKLHDSAQTVYGDILTGADPEDTIVAAAKSASYSKAWTSRLCEITNRLIAVDHIDRAEGDKAASEYPVVDVDRVLNRIFPTAVQKTKAASVAGMSVLPLGKHRYSQIPSLTEKAASISSEPKTGTGLCGFPTEQALLDRADAVRKTLKRARTAVGERVEEASAELAPLCKMAATAIKESGINPAELEERAVAWFGKDAHQVMGAIGSFAQDFTRFNGKPRLFTTNPWDRAPYSHVKAAIIAFRQNAVELETQKRITDIAFRAETQLSQGIRKVAGVKSASTLGTALFLGMPERISKMTHPEKATGQDLSLAGLTPEDVTFLNSIKAREALVGALNDDVISRSDIGDVVRAYNRTGDLGTRTTMNAATLVTVLRQALEQPDMGGADIKQIQDVEKGLAQQQDVGSMA